ncbi:efflux RND transporter periplasmic adaptor subunit [Holdemania massiliensis]|uniref:efflux RND transporter periplasmic adaptor subunit n=1 Tax=Holdemania massiliensis TaxID=1468449 RepID=UPI001F064B91|nr:efflux RND transporter periplasmic adaptor subunit [Holdemania massiliensis]MCH1941294.1 efflux RND transporter periplasmic adaptor subunit [Holdemania massiliensis]
MKRLWKKHKLMMLAGVLIAAGLAWMLLRPADAAAGYTKETVSRRDITTYNSFVGNVQAADEVQVISKVSAQITSLSTEKGAVVRKGDVLVQLDASAVLNNIALKEAALGNSQTSNTFSISDAQRNYDNYKQALDRGLNSTLNSAAAQKDTAYNALESAKTAYDTAKANFDQGLDSTASALYIARDIALAERDSAQQGLNAAAENTASAQAALNTATDQVQAIQTQIDAAKAEDPIVDVTTLEGQLSAATQAQTQAQSTLDAAQAAQNEAQTALTQAQNNLDLAQAQLDQARSAVLQPLQKQIDSAQSAYDTACTSYDTADLQVHQQLDTYAANLEKAKATANTKTSQLELQNLRDSLSDYTIVAPCDGTVTALNAAEGEMAASGKAMATLSNLNAMEISIKVDEYSVMNTGIGSSVTVYVDSIDQTYEGTLSWVAESATITNGVSYYEATVSFTADEQVKSGMSVEVRLTNVDQKNVIAVPVEALNYHEDNTAYVLIANGRKAPLQKEVQVGAADGSYVEILEGLSEGDLIVYSAARGELMIGPGMIGGIRGQ